MNDESGGPVSNAGDVNGDGFDDLIIGAGTADPNGKNNAGEAYIVFGKASGYPESLNLNTLDGTNGFRINGMNAQDNAGNSVSAAGDVNGDGVDDVIIQGSREGAGAVFVLFGKTTSFAATVELGEVDGSDGFRINGTNSSGRIGESVSSAGDVNGDGFDDLLIGAQDAGADANGESYVIFGKAEAFDAVLDLGDLDGTNGFRLEGIDQYDFSGNSVSNAGDVNGDGFDDIIVSAQNASPNGRLSAGESYVVFGKQGGFSASMSLGSLDGTNGFQINGINSNDGSGNSVSTAGDVNGDGFDDVIIGARNAGSNGESYVVFGQSAFSASIELAALDGTNGFKVNGVMGHAGDSVSRAGDTNGDGFDDLIVGSPQANPNNNSNAGESYVVFGRATGFSASLALSDLNGSNGFRITGSTSGDFSGLFVSDAGDINGDGFGDVIIGAIKAAPGGVTDAGSSYVVFGGNFTGGEETVVGDSGSNVLVATHGPVNTDILIGAQGDDSLFSDGDKDVLLGGEGDDDLHISNTAFENTRLMAGGNGFDELVLDGNGLHLDLTVIADNRIVDIEQIDIRGNGANVLSLDALEVVNISSHSNTLVVLRDIDDTVHAGENWAHIGNETIGGKDFNVFEQGAAVLKIQDFKQVPSALVGRVNGTWWLAESNGVDSFTNVNYGGWDPNAGWTDVQTGDFNNDGLADVAGRTSTGQWWIGVDTGASFNTELWGAWVPSLSWQDVQVADVDNDGDSDIVGRASNGDWWVARSDGNSFTNERWGRWSPNVTWSNVMVADINGDGNDDIVGQTPNGQWWAARSNGSNGFATELWGYFATQANWQDVQVGDFNGDGNDDVVGRTGSGAWWVGLSNGTNGFTNQNWGGWSASAGWQDVMVADLNGDGSDDIIGRTSNGQWWSAQSTGSSFNREYWGYWVPSLNWQDVNVIDVDQDGNQDLVGRASNGGLWVARSNGQNFTNQLWGFWNPNANWQNVMAFNNGPTSASTAFIPNAFAEDDDQFWAWNT